MTVRIGKRVSLLFLICLVALLFFCVPLQAAEKTEVRMGYYNLGDYYQTNEDGTLDSYDAAYLSMIEEYTEYSFTFVDCGNWKQALEMLQAHEIDLVGTMQWSAERETEYEICNQSYGYAVSELAALPERGFIYEDYDQLSGVTIGCVEQYLIHDYLLELMEDEGFTAEIRNYENQTALEEALESGEIDVIAANAYVMREDWQVISRFAYEPIYFASWAANKELIQEVSEAIIQINIYQEEFDDGLITTYFPEMVSAPYNKEELEFIARGDVYTIYLDAKTRPLAWYDADTDTMDGILVDICKLLEKNTGVQFEIRPVTEKPDEPDEFSVEYYTFTEQYHASYNGDGGRTESILDEDFLFYHISGTAYDSNPMTAYKVALPKGREGYIEHLQEQYPGYEIVTYDTPKACLERLIAKDVDLVFLCDYVADYIIIAEDIGQVVSIPTTAVQMKIGLQAHGGDAELLADIINKGYRLIGTDELNDIKLNQVSGTVPNPTLSYLFRAHPVQFVLISTFFVLLLIAIAVLVIYVLVIRGKNQRILEANQARMEFFSRMSHDMRTPMNGILGMARLSRDVEDVSELRHNMNMVEESGTYMLQLINDTLDLQRIETGRLQLQPEVADAGVFFEGVFDMVRATAIQKKVTFKVSIEDLKQDCFYRIDAVRLKQIFSNLLSNAIKFTPEGGCVEFVGETLGVTTSVSHNRFQVRDNGIGISSEFLKNGVFTAYSQEHNQSTRENVGSGLGLAITKSLVEMMGGRIEVESEPGKGSVFTIWLDIELIDRETAKESKTKEYSVVRTAKEQLRGRRILLCEDHPLNAEIAQKILCRAGCEVEWAADGAKGLALFRESKTGYYDAILMDIRMPEMDGLQTAEAIRGLAREDALAVPIIAMTANAYDEDIRKSLDAGMNAHLAKPIEPGVLYTTLSQQLKVRDERAGKQ